jgi:hypothetical protein
MPIDPSIVLGLKPPPTIDPMEAMGKAAQYRNLISETAYRDQERQTNQQKQIREQQTNAEADRELAAQKAEGDLMAQNTGPDGTVDHSKVVQGLAQGGFGKQASSYMARVQIPDEKARLDNHKNQLEAGKKQLDMIGGALQSLSGTPDEQLAQAYDQNLQQLSQQGVKLDGIPPSAQILQQGGLPALRQFITQHAAAAIDADKQVTAHQKDLEYAQKLIEFKQKVATEAPKVQKDWTDTLGQLFGSADNPDHWQAAQKTAREMGAPVNLVNQFGEFGPEAQARANELGKTPEQRQTAATAAATLAETKNRDAEAARHNQADEAAKRSEIALKQKEFQAEYGGDAVKGWAATIKDNPDAVSEVPPKLRTGVQQEFTKSTGLPFPKPLSGPTKTQETAARNGLAALQQVAEDIKDPEIQARLGPIMGRLGNAEQDVGATVGLSPEAAAKAQRLRTNMRMMAMQEGRSVFGGRIPQQLMESFQSSSPNVKMDPGTLTGALQGMQDAGMRALDTADQERFGGKMRSREDRGVSAVQFGAKKIGSKAEYDALPKGSQYVDADGKTYTKK